MSVIAIPIGRTGKGTVALLEPYVQAVIDAGGIPQLIAALPGTDAHVDAYLAHADAVLLTGGGDINPRRYAQSITTSLQAVDDARDAFELAALDWSLRNDKRVLGICRGAQLMGVHTGGSLIQDLPTQGHLNHKATAIDAGYTEQRHDIAVEEGSLVARMLGNARGVNSEHHQAIGTLGDGLRAVAWSSDGVIEAVERDLWVGVQWHPEYMTNERAEHLNVFRWLVHGEEGIEVYE
jgi:putative glutamine amidotransferase